MKIRYNTNEFDRDPSIYLGIDGYPIPLSLFKGVDHRSMAMISNTNTAEVGFIIDDQKEEVLLVSNQVNAYVSREDIEGVKEWIFIGEPLIEFITPDGQVG